MIFVSVGTQLPFDRLLQLTESVVKELSIDEPVICQSGPSEFSSTIMTVKKFIDEDEYNAYLTESRLFIGHAGMGSIIKCLDFGVGAVLLARDASLGEHRNNHQFSTCEAFSNVSNVVYMTKEEENFRSKIKEKLLNPEGEKTSDEHRRLSPYQELMAECLHALVSD